MEERHSGEEPNASESDDSYRPEKIAAPGGAGGDDTKPAAGRAALQPTAAAARRRAPTSRRRMPKPIEPRVYFVPNIGEVISLAQHNEVVRLLSLQHERVVEELKEQLVVANKQAQNSNTAAEHLLLDSAREYAHADAQGREIMAALNAGEGMTFKGDPLVSGKKRKRPPRPKSEEERKLRRQLGWIRGKESRKSLNDDKWEKKYAELKAFKEQHGHLNVQHTENKSLYRWISMQRTDHLNLREGKPTSMTPYRIQKLKELGFVWSCADRVSFEERFTQLKAYEEKHGHCNVPSIHSKDIPTGLGNWVGEQRRRYKRLLQNDPLRKERAQGHASLTAAKIEALERLGFQWQLRKHKT